MSLTNVPSPMARPVVVPFRASVPRSHVVPATVQARIAGHPCAPYDHELDDLDIDGRRMAMSALIGFAATAESRAVRDAAGVVDAMIRRGALVLFGPDNCPPRGLPRTGGVA